MRCLIFVLALSGVALARRKPRTMCGKEYYVEVTSNFDGMDAKVFGCGGEGNWRKCCKECGEDLVKQGKMLPGFRCDRMGHTVGINLKGCRFYDQCPAAAIAKEKSYLTCASTYKGPKYDCCLVEPTKTCGPVCIRETCEAEGKVFGGAYSNPKNGHIVYNCCKPSSGATGKPEGPKGMKKLYTAACWKNTYGRGLGHFGKCYKHEERNGLLCYPDCKKGYSGNGPVCWSNCPASWHKCGCCMCTRDKSTCTAKVLKIVGSAIGGVGALATVAGAGVGIGQFITMAGHLTLPKCRVVQMMQLADLNYMFMSRADF